MITKQQMSEVKEYLRYMIIREAVEQIEDEYDPIELNEEENEGGKTNWAKKLTQGLWLRSLLGSEDKPNETPPVSGDLSQDKAIEVKRREKSISFQNLEHHLGEINRHYNNLVRNGQLISGWEKHASVAELINQMSLFHATEKHDSGRFEKLQEAGINSPAVFSGLFRHYDEGGNLSTIIDHVAKTHKILKTSISRKARHIIRFTNGTTEGQPGIPHPHRINGTHLYGEDTTTHSDHHSARLRDFNAQHGSDISRVLRTLRSL